MNFPINPTQIIKNEIKKIITKKELKNPKTKIKRKRGGEDIYSISS
jgi:hypothetical protein